MRQERFKMERQGLVVEGQQVEVTERSPNTNLFTYVVEPAVAMSGIYKTSERYSCKTGRNQRNTTYGQRILSDRRV